MDKNFRKFVDDTLKPLKRHYTYSQILQGLKQRINAPMNLREEKSEKIKNRSGYIITEIDSDDCLYTSMRIGTHYPKLANYITHNSGVPANKDNAHICLLIFGYDEFYAIKSSSARGNYKIGDSYMSIPVPLSHATYAYYQAQLSNDKKMRIPYHIYHFFPEYITQNDIELLAKASDEWIVNEGDVAFNVPDRLSENVYYHKHSESGISSIDCEMILHKSNSLKESNIRVTAGQGSVMSVDMGSVTIVSPEGEEMTLHGTLEVKSCSNRDVDVLNALRFGLDDDKTGDDNPESDKKRFEELGLSPEGRRIYEAVMRDVKALLRERFGDE